MRHETQDEKGEVHGSAAHKEREWRLKMVLFCSLIGEVVFIYREIVTEREKVQ